MKRRRFLASIASAAAAAGPPGEAFADRGDLYAADVLRGDLTYLWQTMLDVGADPFRTSDRSAVTAAYEAALASFDAPATASAFYLAAARLFARLNDGHVDVTLPGMMAYAKASGAFFPFRFAIDDDGLWILQGSESVPVGSRLVSIGGRSEPELRALALATAGGQTLPLVRRRAARQLIADLYALDGAAAAFDVTIRTPDGALRSETVQATTPPESGPIVPYTYSTLADGKIGYLDYRSCEDRPRFQSFLLETFATIARDGTRGLVIDVRRNGGGDSRLNDDLWNYIGGKPFRQFGGVATRASARLKREYGHDKYVRYYGEDAWAAPNGTYLEKRYPPDALLAPPPSTPFRFDGRTVLLIGTGTFSSAMACAVAAKDYGLATLVGEETGEPVVSTGEVYSATAPATGVRGNFTTKVFFGPRERPDRQGVVPDVVAAPTRADLAKNDDVVLTRGIEIASGP